MFSDNLKAVRKEKGWTQKQAAENLGIAKHNLAAYEEGRAKPRYETMEKIISVYEIKEPIKFMFK